MFKKLFSRKKPALNGAVLPSSAANHAAPRPYSSDPLDAVLVHLSPTEVLTVGEAMTGLQIYGGTGSGKTSGSGKTLALSMLNAGFGGLVLCAKPDEAETWRRYARESGRESSFLFMDGKNDMRFDFLNYELKAYAEDGHSQVDNAVDVLMNILEVDQEEQSGGDSFWKDSTRQLLTSCFAVLLAAYGKASLLDVFKMATSAPQSAASFGDVEKEAKSFFHITLQKAVSAPERPLHPSDKQALIIYFRDVWVNLADKTRSNIVATLSAMSGRFLQGRLREVFCNGTSILPELTHSGAVIVLDMPIKTWGGNGRIAQHIFKYAWQRATERRDITKGVPVFLWTDEAQLFLNSYDAEFQGTARSSRAITVNLTQNLDAYRLAIGGRNPDHAVYNLMGNLKTKIFHANDCVNTNRYAADLIGQGVVRRRSAQLGTSAGKSEGYNEGYNRGTSDSGGVTFNESVSYGSSTDPTGKTSYSHNVSSSSGHSSNSSESRGESFGSNRGYNESRSRSAGWSEQKDYLFDPATFRTGLRTGGKQNGLIVDGVIVRQGADAPPFTIVGFSQV